MKRRRNLFSAMAAGASGGLRPVPGALQDLFGGLEPDAITLNDLKQGANADEPVLRNVNCIRTNGTTGYISLNTPLDLSDIIEVRAKFNATSDAFNGGTSASSNRFYWGIFSGAWIVGYGSVSDTGGVADTEWHDFKYDQGELYVDEVLVADASAGSFTVSLFQEYLIGARSVSGTIGGFSDMTIARIKINGGAIYSVGEGSGTISYDVSVPEVMVFLGDSNTQLSSFGGVPYADVLAGMLPATWTTFNEGVGGWQTTDITSSLATTLDPHYDESKKCVVSLMVGVNDFGLGGKDLATTVADYKTLIDAILDRKWGLQVISYYGWQSHAQNLSDLNDQIETYCVGKCQFFDGAAVLNITSSIFVNPIYRVSISDNHLNDLGGQTLADALLPSISLVGRYDATIVDSIWTTADGIPCYFHEHGGRVAVVDTPPYIPALLDGTAAADGNEIANPAGFTHNGSEADVQQTDADEAVFGGVSFYGDGVTWDVKTKAQMDAQHSTGNGAFGLWIKKVGDNIYRMTQYSVTRNWLPGEVMRNENYFGGGSAALRDAGGELITDVNGFVIITAG